MQGIYVITCIPTGEQYIGQTNNHEMRWMFHREALDRKRHHNKRLSAAWEKYGSSAFEFTMLAIVEDDQRRIAMERDYIRRLQPAFNMNPAYRKRAKNVILL